MPSKPPQQPPPPLLRYITEVGLLSTTVIYACYRLITHQPQNHYAPALALLLLMIAVALDSLFIHPRFAHDRVIVDGSLVLGAVTLPLVFVAQLINNTNSVVIWSESLPVFWIVWECSVLTLLARQFTTINVPIVVCACTLAYIIHLITAQLLSQLLVVAIVFIITRHHLPRILIRSFSQGEATLAATLVTLVITQCALSPFTLFAPEFTLIRPLVVTTDALFIVCQNMLCTVLIIGLFLRPLLLLQQQQQHQSRVAEFYVRFVVALFGVVYPWVWVSIGVEPFSWLVRSISTSSYVRVGTTEVPVRWSLIVYWLVCTVVGVQLAPGVSSRVPNIVRRKYYHLLAVVMFVPGIVYQPRLVSLAFAAAMMVFLVLEYFRVLRIPPVGPAVHAFYARYLDTRDSGTIVLTHTYLLLGCALPLWLHAALFNDLQWQTNNATPAMAGVWVLGIGDAAASLVGSFCGRWRWAGSKKTVEGTSAAVVCIIASSTVASWLLPNLPPVSVWATVCVCVLESVTDQIDNLFLPLYYYTLLQLY